jgi:hypothetical protein
MSLNPENEQDRNIWKKTEVENILYMYTAMLECQVVEVADPKWGEGMKGR